MFHDKYQYSSNVWRDERGDILSTGLGRCYIDTERMAKDIVTARPGAKVIDIGAVNTSLNTMKPVADINVLGSYNTFKATLPYLVESAAKHRTDGKTEPAGGTGGRIAFVSATLHYAGVDAMAMSVAIKQGPKGITSNIRERSYKAIPIGRYGTVKEIADATGYLFSVSSNFINSETLEFSANVSHPLYLLWFLVSRQTVNFIYSRCGEHAECSRRLD
ncbi:hypothetical protein HBI23_254060 [Parastagonospora nodorum]|nr:hypothetical protein HBI23_254060 [Parastagonospora nodorum]KAH5621663.1 hypothetical protein HBI51_249640 [Parastagonospora nodorum]KAH5983387.1 hypothetical protein HBI84_247890 [Parastagonospora nodorum]KAH6133480.1 hypothetical protein HBI68_253850 [Parastagonospora nodorum]KAH6380467.1 hypothetical protein HBI08_238330 [Parastagonospora nodorum]